MKSSIVLIAIVFLAGKTMAQNLNCTITCPSNIIVKAEAGKEGANVNFSGATGQGECGAISYTPASGSFFRLGSHSVIVTSVSGQKCSFTVIVTDNEPPVLSQLRLSTDKLWPASNKMKKVGVYYSVSDNGEKVNTVLTVTSNATDSDTKDWEIVDAHLVKLKASRLHDGTPRVYTITVTSTDDAGNKTTRSTSISVSKNKVDK
jgi:HYR domain